MSKNVRIAKELIRLAKSLVAENGQYNEYWFGHEHHCVDYGHEAFDCYESAIVSAFEDNKQDIDAALSWFKNSGLPVPIVVGACYIIDPSLDNYGIKEAQGLIQKDYRLCGGDAKATGAKIFTISEMYQKGGKIYWVYLADPSKANNHFPDLAKRSTRAKNPDKYNDEVKDDSRKRTRSPFKPY